MPQPYVKVVCLGIVAGMRAAVAPALVSRHLAGRPAAEGSSLLASPRVAGFLRVMALGELLGDKLPTAPDRIEPGPLFGRIVSGAVCGAALAASERERAGVGAFIGVFPPSPGRSRFTISAGR